MTYSWALDETNGRVSASYNWICLSPFSSVVSSLAAETGEGLPDALSDTQLIRAYSPEARLVNSISKCNTLRVCVTLITVILLESGRVNNLKKSFIESKGKRLIVAVKTRILESVFFPLLQIGYERWHLFDCADTVGFQVAFLFIIHIVVDFLPLDIALADKPA